MTLETISTTTFLKSLPRISGPKTPSESIASRRTPCFGPSIAIDMTVFLSVSTLCRDTLQDVLNIIECAPKKLLFEKPENYIKQKFFHASPFPMTPFATEEAYDLFFHAREGLDGGYALQAMHRRAMLYLEEKQPNLLPQGFEYNETLGTILARYLFVPNDCQPENKESAPLVEFAARLDPEEKFPVWDKTPYRQRSVAVVLCALDCRDPEKIAAIKEILARSSMRLREIGTLPVTHLTVIDWYDKRTLSPAHRHLFNESFHYKHARKEASFFRDLTDTRLWEARNESEETRTAFDRRFGVMPR